MLTVTLHIDPADIKELIGNDLGGHYIVAEVKVEPKFGKDILLDRDDFQLRTDKDGEKAKPFAASQIAGTRRLDHRAGRPQRGRRLARLDRHPGSGRARRRRVQKGRRQG